MAEAALMVVFTSKIPVCDRWVSKEWEDKKWQKVWYCQWIGKNQRKREGQARTCKPNHQECDHRWSRQYDVSTFLAPTWCRMSAWGKVIDVECAKFEGLKHPLLLITDYILIILISMAFIQCLLRAHFCVFSHQLKLSPFLSIPSGNLSWRWSIDGGTPMVHVRSYVSRKYPPNIWP